MRNAYELEEKTEFNSSATSDHKAGGAGGAYHIQLRTYFKVAVLQYGQILMESIEFFDYIFKFLKKWW